MTLKVELTEHAYNNIMTVDSISLGRMPYKGIIMSAINAIKRGEVQEPKTGHWLHRNDDCFDWLECSNCGYGSEGEVGFGHETPYCPYCGSKNEVSK